MVKLRIADGPFRSVLEPRDLTLHLQCFYEVGHPALPAFFLIFRRQVTIDEITVEASDLYLVRNTAGVLNLEALLRNLAPEESESTEDPVETAPDDEKPAGPLPPVLLDRFALTSSLNFINEKETGDPFRLGLNIQILANRLGTVGDPEELSGDFKVSGNLAGNSDLFVINAAGKVAPVVDPQAPSFDLRGKVESLDIDLFEVFSKEFEITKGSLNMELDLSARNGVFQEGSRFVLLLGNPEFGGSLQVSALGAASLITIDVPIRGTVMAPEVSIFEAVRRSLVASFGAGTVEQLRDQAAAIAAGARAQAEAVREQAEQRVEAAREQVGQQVEEARAQVSEATEQARSQLQGAIGEGNLDAASLGEAASGILGGAAGSGESTGGGLGGLRGALGGLTGQGAQAGESGAESDGDSGEASSGETPASRGLGSLIPGLGSRGSSQPEPGGKDSAESPAEDEEASGEAPGSGDLRSLIPGLGGGSSSRAEENNSGEGEEPKKEQAPIRNPLRGFGL